jgi:hypothetical protein
MKNWTLRDLDDQKYSFPEFELAAGAQVRVWTKSGVDSSENLYWGREDTVWNFREDTAVLRNPDGEDISHFSYTNPSANSVTGSSALSTLLHQQASERAMQALPGVAGLR